MKVLDYEGLKTFATKIKSLLAGKQDKLTAGSNITITNNKISAVDTKYSAGENITITDNKISASGKVTVVEKVEVPMSGAKSTTYVPEGKVICRKYSNGFCSIELNTDIDMTVQNQADIPIGFRPLTYRIGIVDWIGGIVQWKGSSSFVLSENGRLALNAGPDKSTAVYLTEFFYHPEA